MRNKARVCTGPYRAVLTGTGSAVPERILTNEDLSRMVETSDEWITTRTGIKKRHIVADSDTTATLSTSAARKALDVAGLSAEALDLIIVATVSPEMVFPSTACFVQSALGAKNAWAFDLNAACSGFVYALATAERFVSSGAHKNVMVIGAETLSRLTDYSDRTSCILFGDGAGAALLQQGDGKGKAGVLYSRMDADGTGWESISCRAYGSRNPVSRPLANPRDVFMEVRGREVYQLAVRRIVEIVEDALADCEITLDDIDLIIPHQMNARIIESAAKRLNLPEEKVFVNITEYGNTSAASIPIALDECRRTGRIRPGTTALFVSFGAGLTWGANIVRF
jgi:3-oxoacyl-[acyl-carrier-protein] synthase III